jgi:hypothetical protein
MNEPVDQPPVEATQQLPPLAPPPPPPPPGGWNEPAADWEPSLPPSTGPRTGPSFLARNSIALVACALSVIAIAFGIAVLATRSSGSAQASVDTPAAAAPSSATGKSVKAVGAKGAGAAAGKATRATIVTESGSTWTVQTAKGATVTVTITPQTAFGTPKAPVPESQFVVGAPVIITGTVDNGAATAVRVIAAKASAPTPGATPTTSTTES